MNTPKLVAHRGYMARYPENSLRGLQAALEAGACFVEFDVQMNADHEFIVIHDDTFSRTGKAEHSVFTTSTRICKDISVHEPDRFGDKFYPEPVPLLYDILELVKEFPNAAALVEIKEESLQHWGMDRVMDSLLDILAAYADQCIVISFDEPAIAYAKQNSNLATGWVVHKYDEDHYQRALQLQPGFLMCNHKKIPQGERPWEDFKHWMLYDITDPELAIHFGELGVELIETADIGGMLKNPRLNKMACPHGL
jgi:glycerophosphoryl diester phosphodiesterase